MKAFGVDPEHGLDGLPAGRQPGGEERQDRQVPLRRRLYPSFHVPAHPTAVPEPVEGPTATMACPRRDTSQYTPQIWPFQTNCLYLPSISTVKISYAESLYIIIYRSVILVLLKRI